MGWWINCTLFARLLPTCRPCTSTLNCFYTLRSYEGFGIPIIEALFSETPVITSNVSSLPEAAGPESWLVNPASAAEIAHGMEVLLTDTEKRQRQIVAGFEHAQQFLGAPLTEQLMAVYEEVL
ncbi:MAG: glycosyltransferase [Saprospiraceae bacterium]